MKEFVASIERPRRIIILVKAGAAVDAVIAELKPLLDDGDVMIDGGNSFFQDTIRRSMEFDGHRPALRGHGRQRRRRGRAVRPEPDAGRPARGLRRCSRRCCSKIAAQVKDGPCVTYIGPGGAGHYVKMVHNGIEYGDMQLIAETYNIMKHALGADRAGDGRHLRALEWRAAELLPDRDHREGAGLHGSRHRAARWSI